MSTRPIRHICNLLSQEKTHAEVRRDANMTPGRAEHRRRVTVVMSISK